MGDWTTKHDDIPGDVAGSVVIEDLSPVGAGGDDSEDVESYEAPITDALGRAVVPEWVADAEPEDLTRCLEAICFSLNRPVTISEAAAILGCGPRAAAAAVDVLAVELREHGVMLQRHHDEFQIVTRPDTAWAVQRALNPERPGRLSRPALETLAIVAYRQPVTRAVIEAIRGVNCEAVLDSLERRGCISELGRQDSPGQPRLFGTTLRFLQMVGIERIEDLPPLPEGVDIPNVTVGTWHDIPETDPDLDISTSDAQPTPTNANPNP